MALRSWLVVSLLATLPALWPVAGRAQPPRAYTDPDAVDEDFPFQGEYRGWQRSRPSLRSSEPVGLQVLALGEGKFQAMKYYGGLPGERWFGGPRHQYSGQRIGDLVRLSSDDYIIELDGARAELFTADGRLAGVLEKVSRESPTLHAPPPPGAIVLFDGETNRFRNPTVTDDGLLREGTETLDGYGDFRLHAEFRIAYKPLGRGQDRGNSGFYLQNRYEIQVLDSFGLEGVENECGALYRIRRPDVNMCLPPLSWQTYDIDFTMPKFDENGEKIADGRIAVWHNGVLVQNNVAIPHQTGNGKPEGPQPLPTKLQDHKNPVVFRNLWLLPKSPGEAASDHWVHLPRSAPPVPVQSWRPPAPVAVLPGGIVTLQAVCP